MKNYARLHEELDFIKMHPLAHRQGSWVALATTAEKQDAVVAECGTTGCLAGWAVIHEYDLKVISSNTRSKYTRYEYVNQLTGDIFGMDDVQMQAVKIFGLDYVEASLLFDSGNTLDEMENIVKDWENNE